jgi:hypothetical protein
MIRNKYYIKRYAGGVEMFWNRYQQSWQYSITDECFYFQSNAAVYDSEGLHEDALVYVMPRKLEPVEAPLEEILADGLIPVYMNETRDLCGRLEYLYDAHP